MQPQRGPLCYPDVSVTMLQLVTDFSDYIMSLSADDNSGKQIMTTKDLNMESCHIFWQSILNEKVFSRAVRNSKLVTIILYLW